MPRRAQSASLARQSAAVLAVAVLLLAVVRSNAANERLPLPLQAHRCAATHAWQQVQDKDSADLFVAPAPADLPANDLPSFSVVSAAAETHFERALAYSLSNRPPPRA